MDKKSKIFFLVFFLLIVGSVAVTYWRIMVKRDYIISAQQECDPATEPCFVSSCDPESDEECAATPEEERTTYYKTILKNAKNIPPCDPYKNECPTELTCQEGEPECSIEYCDESNVPEGEECNDPEQYAIDNPPEECSCGGEEEGAAEDTTGNGEDVTEPSENENTNSSEEASADEPASDSEEPACDCSQSEEVPAEEAPTLEQ